MISANQREKRANPSLIFFARAPEGHASPTSRASVLRSNEISGSWANVPARIIELMLLEQTAKLPKGVSSSTSSFY